MRPSTFSWPDVWLGVSWGWRVSRLSVSLFWFFGHSCSVPSSGALVLPCAALVLDAFAAGDVFRRFGAGGGRSWSWDSSNSVVLFSLISAA